MNFYKKDKAYKLILLWGISICHSACGRYAYAYGDG